MTSEQMEHDGKGESFAEQLRQELAAVTEGRKSVGLEQDSTASAIEGSAVDRAHGLNLLGLALSGGGIRSATFNLGIIQRLAQLGLLHRIDYLSTVSGGGYIGAWLSAWVYRERDAQGKPSRPGVLAVEERLRESVAKQARENPLPPREPPQVSWLRRFSNYLTPRVGALSTDTLTGVATYLRNLFLNQAVLITFAFSLLALPWLLVAVMQELPHDWLALPIAYLVLVAGSFWAGYETQLTDLTGDERPQTRTGDGAAEQRNRKRRRENRKRYWTLLGCFVAASVLVGISITARPLNSSVPVLLLFGIGGYGLSTFWGRLRGLDAERAETPSLWDLGVQSAWSLIAGTALGCMLIVWTKLVSGPLDQLAGPLPAVAFGPFVVLAAILLTITLHLGLVSRGISETTRELWSRHGAHQLRFCIGWLALTGASLFGPLLLMQAGTWVAALGGTTWVMTTLAGVLAGSSDKTGAPGETKVARFVAAVAPYVFVAGLLLILSYAGHRLIWSGWSGLQSPPTAHLCVKPPPGQGETIYALSGDIGAEKAGGRVIQPPAPPQCGFERYAAKNAKVLGDDVRTLLVLALGLFVISVLLSRRVDINVFGFHMFYRNRIERCYLGASNLNRQPHPLTGLDPMDSPWLTELTAGEKSWLGQRPFPIVNTTLNVTRSRNLAWQERKAASFTFTPMFCGYELEEPDPKARYGRRLRTCYQPTGDYLTRLKGPNKKMSLAVPVAISGAAASPNAGYHTNGATAFLMTVFNVRLGWWMQNPRFASQWREPGPKLALFLLLKELAGSTDDESKYVYLSDGGHFENLGIYELVRRRCRYVVACDAGCDPKYGFEDLGNAVRKCQIDLGIDIEIDPHAIRPDAATGYSAFHCAIGRIHYERVDPRAQPGYLLYIKASLTGDEPVDVLQYAVQNPSFPHQTTADQWYSESQFESYRKLGYHLLGKAMSDVVQSARRKSGGQPLDLEGIFDALAERWYPPSAQVKASFSRHGESLAAIFELIRKDRNLEFLDKQIYPEWDYLQGDVPDRKGSPSPPMLPKWPEEIRAGFYVCNSLIQLMENMYLDLNLEDEYRHPDNRGWMNLFRHWSWAGMFRVTWAISASTYGARFQRFCENRLGLELGKVKVGEPIPVEKIEDLPLNFVEKDHVRKVIRALGFEQECTRFALIRLSLEVADPFERQSEAGLSFPFAFALAVRHDEAPESELAYYRVQDHLRMIGLGRKGFVALRAEPSNSICCLVAPGTRGLARISKEIPEADYPAMQRMWSSVVRVGKSPELGTGHAREHR